MAMRAVWITRPAGPDEPGMLAIKPITRLADITPETPR
jgi:hypothetical protein